VVVAPVGVIEASPPAAPMPVAQPPPVTSLPEGAGVSVTADVTLAGTGIGVSAPLQRGNSILTLVASSPDRVGLVPTGFSADGSPFDMLLESGGSAEAPIVPSAPLHLTQHLNQTDLDAAQGDATRLHIARWTGSSWQAQACANDGSMLDCWLPRTGTFQVLVAPPPGDVLDSDLPNGHFYKQANGFGGAGDLGFAVVDDADATFWSEFVRLGGVDRVGFPISQRFTYQGFLTQAFQKMVLQWRPDLNQVEPVNIFDELHNQGDDQWLNDYRQVPPADDTSADAGLGWDQVVTRHVSLLSDYPSLRDAYTVDPGALEAMGLPLAVRNYGAVTVVRLQRATLQLWSVDTPWAAAGSIILGNAGDIAKELGLWPDAAMDAAPAS
jgi:hypothetical protein